MKGIIFNLLEDFIVSHYGDELYEQIVQTADTGQLDPFQIVGPGSYPDEAFTILLENAAKLTDTPAPELLREMGCHSLPKLAERYPHFFAGYTHPREFLKTAAMIHHVEVKKLYNDADVPTFFVEDRGAEEIYFTYKSRRHLCSLVEGLIKGLGDYYNISLSIKQTECMHSGNPACRFLIQYNDQ